MEQGAGSMERGAGGAWSREQGAWSMERGAIDRGRMILFSRRFFSFFLAVIICLSGWLVTGCGYHLKTAGEPVGIKIQSLAIPLMTSTSSYIGFEPDFTKIIREEFISHAKVPLLSSESAQTVLTGRIYDIKTEPLSYDYRQQTIKGHDTIYGVTNKRRLKIRLDVKLTDRTDGKIVWRAKAMEEKAGFTVGADPLANRYNQQQALEKIARRLAKRIYLRTMERF